MYRRIAQLAVKQYFFPLIGLTVLLLALPFSIWQISKVASISSKASSFTLVPYPGLSWSQPKPYTVSFLKNAQTADEEIAYAEGESVIAESEKNISQEVYFFYNRLLVSKGYTQVHITGDPKIDTQWSVTYESDGNICQLQYYPTPYTSHGFTILLFFGNS